jgi:tetratricopeptide (TPR) repeat protein
MMNYDVIQGALAAVSAGLALELMAFRHQSSRVVLIDVMSAWRRISSRRANTLSAALLGVSVLALAPHLMRDNDEGTRLALAAMADASTDHALASFAAAPSAKAATDTFPGIGDRSDEDGDTVRAKALESLRAYSAKITETRQMVAALGSDAPASTLPDVDTMIDRLVERLDKDPGNADGWRMLGWSHLNTGKAAEAVKAYEKAVALAPSNAEFATSLAEARRQNVQKADAAKTESALPAASGAVPHP